MKIGLKLISGLFGLLFWPCASFCMTIGEPIVAIAANEFNPTNETNYQPDAPITTFREGNWLVPMWNRGHGEIVHAKSRGTVERPMALIEWVKNQKDLFNSANGKFDGTFWIVNTFTDERGGILAFFHLENAQGTGKGGGTGKSRIGLGWSDNNGESFVFVGNIIIPYGDPNPFNVQGVPYIIKNGYFYIYYHDTAGLTVARAPIRDVVTAAKKGKVTPWMKYIGPDKGFISDGLGGASYRIGIDGISHSDAACSSYNQKCYLILTQTNDGGRDTWIKVYESTDGVKWFFAKTIIQENAGRVKKGFQYATIVNEDGSDNGIVGSKFFVYCDKDYPENIRATYRWTIDLTK